jgi:hypothetical protein
MDTSIRVYLPAGGAHVHGRGEMNIHQTQV